MIRALFERLVTPSNVRSLGLEELLSLTGEVLNRVDTAAFFQRFEEDTAVQYFYEPFLEAFDPELRKQLGVWYTPREIVRYMVERVDTVLRTELGLASGLADPNVYVLDPACGTGAYLVEVLDRSYREFGFLKRPLTLAEAEEVQAMARRLTALCLLQPELDANYLRVKSATWPPEPALVRVGAEN